MRSLKIDFKRCRPALGTFVSISVSGASAEKLTSWTEDAFSVIEEVGRRLSFHDSKSELSSLNRYPIGRWMKISQALSEVLTISMKLQMETEGKFNVAIASPLMAWNLLPGRKREICWKHLSIPGFEVNGLRARRVLPVQLDLGGIAKGYAVDCAVNVLQKYSKQISGCVNAGGDLRVFGGKETPVWLRSGKADCPQVQLMMLKNSALATSTVKPLDRFSYYIDPTLHQPLLAEKTVVVHANHCMLADAFTKIALLSSDHSLKQLVKRYRVEVSVVT